MGVSAPQSNTSEKRKKPVIIEITGFLMVGVARLELAAVSGVNAAAGLRPD